jgi:hypothetical protein
MAGYKEPGFQDRVAAAAKARETALAKLKAKPPVDPAVMAERAAKALEREAALAQRAAERAEAKRLAEEEKAAAAAAAAEEAARNVVPELTEAERKQARDAKYAARKARKSSR